MRYSGKERGILVEGGEKGAGRIQKRIKPGSGSKNGSNQDPDPQIN
jgi:hypothetical protein